jgi:glycosyltransferase involved in cell wall biosynthesis
MHSVSTRLPPTARSALRAQYGIPAEAPVLVYVGSGFERKGVAQALRAIQQHPDVWLVVVGGDKKLAPTGNWPASWALPSE